MILSYILGTLCVVSVYCQELDEIAEFKELLLVENALAVLFSEPCCTCTDCVEAEVLLGAMSQELEDNLNLSLVRLKKADLRKEYGVKSVPALVYIRDGKSAMYDGRFVRDDLLYWLEENRESITKDLDDDTFEHLTQAASGATTGDWLVAFYDESCAKSNGIEPHLEGAGLLLKNKVNVALVDKEKSPELMKRFKIKYCPEVILFRHGKMYRFSLPDITLRTLRRFAEGFYKNSKSEVVPAPSTMFDKLVENALYLIKNHWLLMLFIVSQVIFVGNLILIFLVPKQRPKAD